MREKIGSTAEIEIVSAKTKKNAYQTIEKLLSEYKQQRKGPTAILTQCTRSYYELTRDIPILKEFPNIAVPANDLDNNHRGLLWEGRAATVLAERYMYVVDYFA